MKQIQFQEPGVPADVVSCVDVADPTIAEPDDVVVAIEAFPVNPADLLTLQGYYPRTDPSSPSLGIEAVGVVETIGAAVTDVSPGDRVILLTTDNWSQRKRVKPGDLVRVSKSTDPLTLASLKVNPATASLFLDRFVDIAPGGWVIQNAATSAVGRALIEIAGTRGIRTVNVVRRREAVASLERLGADVVLLDGDDLPQRVAAATGGAAIALALDAVAGAATTRLAACLAPGGTTVVYGAMAGEPSTLDPTLLVFGDIRLRGFWLTRYLASAPRSEVVKLYADLEALTERGLLTNSVDTVFAAQDVKQAISRAVEVGTAGKVYVTFDLHDRETIQKVNATTEA